MISTGYNSRIRSDFLEHWIHLHSENYSCSNRRCHSMFPPFADCQSAHNSCAFFVVCNHSKMVLLFGAFIPVEHANMPTWQTSTRPWTLFSVYQHTFCIATRQYYIQSRCVYMYLCGTHSNTHTYAYCETRTYYTTFIVLLRKCCPYICVYLRMRTCLWSLSELQCDWRICVCVPQRSANIHTINKRPNPTGGTAPYILHSPMPAHTYINLSHPPAHLHSIASSRFSQFPKSTGFACECRAHWTNQHTTFSCTHKHTSSPSIRACHPIAIHPPIEQDVFKAHNRLTGRFGSKFSGYITSTSTELHNANTSRIHSAMLSKAFSMQINTKPTREYA